MNIIYLIILITIFYLCFSFIKINLLKKGFKGPVELPLFGSLLYLGTHPHHTLSKWTKTYGKVFKIFMGDYETIIVSDPKMIREIWLKHFEYFSDRPVYSFQIALGDDHHDVTTSKYNRWKHNRDAIANTFTKSKLKNIEITLSNQSLQLVKRMSHFEKSKEIFYPHHFLKIYSTNVVLSILFSKELTYDNESNGEILEQLIKSTDNLFKLIHNGSLLGFFHFLDSFAIYLLRKQGKEFFKIRQILDDLYREQSNNFDNEDPKNLFDIMIGTDYPEHKERNIKGTAIDLLTTGTETTASTLLWFFLYMVNNPHIQEKAYNEIKNAIGSDVKIINLSHRPDLPYVQAIIKEILRIKPIAPLNVPRICVDDIKIGDYQFRKGNQLMMNIYALHHDEQYWNEPDRFLPERFIGNNHSENWLPFSTGPRNCIGMNLALDSNFLVCSNILLNFKIISENGKKIDDTEIFGLTVHPNEFGVLLESRLIYNL